jgi:hypothetical protein
LGFGFGVWGFGFGGLGPTPQSPIPNPQSPIPNPQSPKILIIICKYQIKNKIILKNNNKNNN